MYLIQSEISGICLKQLKKTKMICLPKSLPTDLRALIENAIGYETDTSKILANLGPLLIRLFNAEEALLSWRSPHAETLNETLIPFTKTPLEPQQHQATLVESWKAKGLDERILCLLLEKKSCLSHSAFSWPFGSIKIDNSENDRRSIPREYSILIPIDHNLAVRRSEDPEFSGYIALFFSSFPQLTDNIVQLIVILPDLLASFFTQHLRTENLKSRETLVVTLSPPTEPNLEEAEDSDISIAQGFEAA